MFNNVVLAFKCLEGLSTQENPGELKHAKRGNFIGCCLLLTLIKSSRRHGSIHLLGGRIAFGNKPFALHVLLLDGLPDLVCGVPIGWGFSYMLTNNVLIVTMPRRYDLE